MKRLYIIIVVLAVGLGLGSQAVAGDPNALCLSSPLKPKALKLDARYAPPGHAISVWRKSAFVRSNAKGLVSKSAVRALLQRGKVRVWVAIDANSAVDDTATVARLDFSGKGDFTDAVVLPLTVEKGRHSFSARASGGAAILLDGKDVFVFASLRYTKRGSTRNLTFALDTARTGTIEAGGRTYHVRLHDTNNNLSVGDRYRPAGRGYHRGDYLILSRDPNFAKPDVQARFGQPVRVNGTWYVSSLSREKGIRIALRPLDGQMGTLTLPATWDAWSLQLISKKYIMEFDQSDGNEVELPAGEYVVAGYDAARKDDDHRPLLALTIRDYGKRAPVKIEAGKSRTLSFLPLQATPAVLAGKRGLFGRSVRLSMTLRDVQGRRVRSVYVRNKRPPAPTITVTDENGKQRYSDTLEYG